MSAKSDLRSLLINDSALVTLVGDADKIRYSWYDEEVGLPQVTIFRLLNAEAYSGDNLVQKLSVPMQIDIWVNYGSSPTAIERRIRDLLKENGYSAIPQQDGQDEPGKVGRATLQVEFNEDL